MRKVMRSGTKAAAAGVLAVAAVAAGAGTADAAETTARGGAATVERGYALACAGEADGVSAYVELYENSAYGAHASVIVETPSGEYGGGFGPETVRLFHHGSIDAQVELDPRGEAVASGESAVVSGTYARTGRPERVHEEIEDAGQRIVTDGLNTRLTTTVSVTVHGTTVPLACDTAFAFDLVVRRTPL